MNTSKKKTAKATLSSAEFDLAFDAGEGFESLDLESATVHSPTRRINIDIPKRVLRQLDNEANRIGVPRTSIIKLWIVEKLRQIGTS